MRGALCLSPTDQQQQSLLYCSTSATDRSLIVPQHFLTSEEFLLQEIWFTRKGTKPSHLWRSPHPPSSSFTLSGNIYCKDPFYPFPFHPSSNIPSTPSLLVLGVPWIIPPGSLTEGGGLFSILTSRHTETCVVRNWQ